MNMKETIKISGMSCNHCVKSVEKELSKLPLQRYSVKINLAEVEYDESKVSHEEITDAIEEAGYEVQEYSEAH